ncbi:hypothetical protein L1987_83423 [Smallanthus sonchifolius]|uniref:Uncharacterized protein n=1 Tax=Smallanthus sonchifolius TaxID=185202 RepID=A0ACB8YCQ7_9ASTR|nr:hypothetical protein L1987_83423 [Smallanthus sonchifolius]
MRSPQDSSPTVGPNNLGFFGPTPSPKFFPDLNSSPPVGARVSLVQDSVDGVSDTPVSLLGASNRADIGGSAVPSNSDLVACQVNDLSDVEEEISKTLKVGVAIGIDLGAFKEQVELLVVRDGDPMVSARCGNPRWMPLRWPRRLDPCRRRRKPLGWNIIIFS